MQRNLQKLTSCYIILFYGKMIEQFGNYENIKFTRDKNFVGRAMKSLFFENEDF